MQYIRFGLGGNTSITLYVNVLHTITTYAELARMDIYEYLFILMLIYMNACMHQPEVIRSLYDANDSYYDS